jgi:hypothetical protein
LTASIFSCIFCNLKASVLFIVSSTSFQTKLFFKANQGQLSQTFAFNSHLVFLFNFQSEANNCSAALLDKFCSAGFSHTLTFFNTSQAVLIVFSTHFLIRLLHFITVRAVPALHQIVNQVSIISAVLG